MNRSLTALAVSLSIVGCATKSTSVTEPSDNTLNNAPRVIPASDPQGFLERNRLKPGVIETASGLQYEIVRRGDGARPVLGDTVELVYSGRALGSDTAVDGNRKSGVADLIDFRNTIDGWQEALQLMPAGSTYIFYIPPKLAYGEEGRGMVGPNAVLIYRLELIRIERYGSSNR
jgi:FKBP-type peptidyl-prolyl cis-trans isomerase